MGRYIKETCPNCKSVISGWHSDSGNLRIGQPLSRCSNCGTILIHKNIAEYAMFNKWLYFRYFIWPVLAGAIVSIIVGYIIAGLIGKEDNTILTLTIIFGVILLSVFLLRIVHVFKKEKKESLERTKDEQYLKELYQAKLISENKYKKMQEYYKNTK